jgi:hypothetical protein
MDQLPLEERVAALEQQVSELRRRLPAPADRDWRQAIGLFPHNELMKQIDAAGQAIRDAERRQARRRKAKGRQTKN